MFYSPEEYEYEAGKGGLPKKAPMFLCIYFHYIVKFFEILSVQFIKYIPVYYGRTTRFLMKMENTQEYILQTSAAQSCSR